MIVRRLLVLGLSLGSLLAASHALAVVETTGLTPEQEARAAALYGQLKCPVCKTQALGASTTFLAEEMKAQIRDMVRLGASDREILQHYVDRYGEWILLSPPAHGSGLWAWLVPAAAALLGALGAMLWLKRRSGGGTPEATVAETLSGDERRAIDALVGD
jgi:cytochrome c-type biogenesis protein CcmH